MKFTYASGQRPLDGFTLKRGIGRGGFGEVYYGVSDGGKEVALKLVRGDQEVELRGIAQCLNLKHNNLVHLFDLRQDGRGDHWVVMEYVAGEPLSNVLARHPNGLPIDLARQWFLALTRAVGYLHDQGIVHRDLKPGNIFLENGLVKVGDYGLCKFISSSQRTAQTQSVGTVYYMAPEISTGNYNKQIDIYSAGVILYEMLTGKVPFEGESAGEILMKHLTAPPDLSQLPRELAPIVAKALAKDPSQRYASMAEMARAIEGLEPAVADARPVIGAAAATATVAAAEPIPTVLPVPVAGQLGELAGSLAGAALTAGPLVVVYGALAQVHDPTSIGLLYFLTVALCWAVLVPGKLWNTGGDSDSWSRRLIMMVLGLGIGAGTLWVTGWSPGLAAREQSSAEAWGRALFASDQGAPAISWLGYFGLALGALRWWKMTERRRPQWFSFFPVLAAGFWALLLRYAWPAATDLWSGALALVLAAAIVQWVSPWEPPPPPPARRVRLRYA